MIKCPVCDKEFKNQKDLDKHLNHGGYWLPKSNRQSSDQTRLHPKGAQ